MARIDRLHRSFYAFVAGILTAVIIAAAVWLLLPGGAKTDTAKVEPARITDIRPILALCSTEIYEEMPFHGRYGTKHIVARSTLTGSITFDLEKLRTDTLADTLVIYLPPEKLELHEATAPDSYSVIDTWNDRLFGKPLTTAEENAIKARAMEYARRRIYARGHVARARTDAANTLARMAAATTGRPVRVIVNPSRGNGESKGFKRE